MPLKEDLPFPSPIIALLELDGSVGMPDGQQRSAFVDNIQIGEDALGEGQNPGEPLRLADLIPESDRRHVVLFLDMSFDLAVFRLVGADPAFVFDLEPEGLREADGIQDVPTVKAIPGAQVVEARAHVGAAEIGIEGFV